MSERKSDWYLKIADVVMDSAIDKLRHNKSLNKTLRISSKNDKRNGYRVVRKLKPPFNTDEKYPTIFYTQLNPVEAGQDLQNEEINAVRLTVEVRVADNQKEGAEFCQLILAEIIKEFKLFHFDVNQFPVFESRETNVSEGIIRCTRIVGADDKDLTYETEEQSN